jgi:hypothetical protein
MWIMAGVIGGSSLSCGFLCRWIERLFSLCSFDHLFDDFITHRFGNNSIHAGGQAAIPILAHRRCGHGHNGYVNTDRLFPADLVVASRPVISGICTIHENQIQITLSPLFQTPGHSLPSWPCVPSCPAYPWRLFDSPGCLRPAGSLAIATNRKPRRRE